MSNARVYLDHAATAPQDKRVTEIMRKIGAEAYGNPSSIHKEGVFAKKILEEARKSIADILCAHADEIIFTGGGTEANNIAVFGTVAAMDTLQKSHIIVSNIEHPSVLECVRELERRGTEITYLPVSSEGIVSANSVKEALRENTVLVSVMYANNEIGTIQPIAEIAKIVRKFRTKNHQLKTKNSLLFHTDACQATNYLDMNVSRLGVDIMTWNASKIYGPKGVGALFVKRGVKLSPQIFGGGQEGGIRSGTENVAAIVGFAEAMKIAEKMKEKESSRLVKLRDFFISEVLVKIPDTVLNGSRSMRLPNSANISFLGADAEEIVIWLDAQGIAISTGSACANISKDGKVSDVILALDGDRIRAMGAVRFTLGRGTKKEDIDHVITELLKLLREK
jgi:cysteine desulfurase